MRPIPNITPPKSAAAPKRSFVPLNRSTSSYNVPTTPNFWPTPALHFGLRKSQSITDVIESQRGFKPSDRKDPSKREFLTNLTKRVFKVGLDENKPPSKPINLEKLFTPAEDAPQIKPTSNRKMFASSSFYSKGLHPTVEDQVELARRISSSLSDISNKTSKGQSMYVNRKKRSVKWVHEGEGQANGTQNGDSGESHGEGKNPLKLVMNPHGQVQDINSLRSQGYNIESALSPDVCLEIVKDLNSPKGKGAELFAKRRKRSEKWVVGENNATKQDSLPDITPLPTPILAALPPISSLPPPSYLPETTQRMQHNQKLDEIQERFTRPRVKLIKSPWEAALETGSVDAAFENVPPVWPTKGSYVAPVVDSYEQALRSDTLSTWTAPPPSSYNGPPKPVYAHNPAYNSSSINRIVDNLQKGVSNVDVYKPKPPQAWNTKYAQQQPQYKGGSHTLPRTKTIIPPPSPTFKASTNTPPVFIPKESGTPISSYPPQPTYTSQPALPRIDYTSLQNYNTAPRGWGEVRDVYRPITFDKPRSPFSDF